MQFEVALVGVWVIWVDRFDFETVLVQSFSVAHPLPNFLDNSLQTSYETKHNRPKFFVKKSFHFYFHLFEYQNYKKMNIIYSDEHMLIGIISKSLNQSH